MNLPLLIWNRRKTVIGLEISEISAPQPTTYIILIYLGYWCVFSWFWLVCFVLVLWDRLWHSTSRLHSLCASSVTLSLRSFSLHFPQAELEAEGAHLYWYFIKGLIVGGNMDKRPCHNEHLNYELNFLCLFFFKFHVTTGSNSQVAKAFFILLPLVAPQANFLWTTGQPRKCFMKGDFKNVWFCLKWWKDSTILKWT